MMVVLQDNMELDFFGGPVRVRKVDIMMEYQHDPHRVFYRNYAMH